MLRPGAPAVEQGLRLLIDVRGQRVIRRLRGKVKWTGGGIDLAVAAARNYRHLGSRGRTVRETIDCLIATFCIEQNHALLHNDFDAFKELLELPAGGACMNAAYIRLQSSAVRRRLRRIPQRGSGPGIRQ